MKAHRLQDLQIWQKSILLVKEVYLLTEKLPADEKYGLVSQIKRCAVSIPSNIAEGAGRNNSKEFYQFLGIAQGSSYELETQFYISYDQNYISKDELTVVLGKTLICKKLLNGFINYYKNL